MCQLPNRCGNMAIFRFFKMAAVRHFGFVLRLFGTTHGGPYRCAKFGWNGQCLFEDIQVSMLCEFGI